MVVEFAMFLLSTKYLNIYICGGAYSICDNLKTMVRKIFIYASAMLWPARLITGFYLTVAVPLAFDAPLVVDLLSLIDIDPAN